MEQTGEQRASIRVWRSIERLVRGAARTLDRLTAPALKPLRRAESLWWVYVAAGLLLLATSSIALRALTQQLELMHLPAQEGFGVQRFWSFDHLTQAAETWSQYWTEATRSLGLASPKAIAIAWILIDLLVFIPGYAAAGGMLLIRGERSPKDERLVPALRTAASLLVFVVLFDVAENLLSLIALCPWPQLPPSPLARAAGVMTVLKMLLAIPVVLALVLFALTAWRKRSEAARATTALLRGQIGIAIVTIGFFSVPIQLPDIFLSLGGVEVLWLVGAAVVLTVATWAIARWMVLSREQRTGPNRRRVERVYASTAVGLVTVSIVNLATDGSPWAPLLPLGLAVAIAVLGAPLRREQSRHGITTDLGQPGVFVPQALSALGATASGGAAITAASLVAVGADRIWLIPVAVVAVTVAVAVLALGVFRLEHFVSGTNVRLRDWKDAPSTTKAALKQDPALQSRLPTRRRVTGRCAGHAALAVLAAILWLLKERVAGAQSVGAAAAVILFMAALTLLLGAVVAAADAWDQLVGLPPALEVMGFARTPIFTLLLIWGMVAAAIDDGGHWDIRKIPGDARAGIHLGDAFKAWKEDAVARAERGRRAMPLVIVATSGGGIRSAYWTSLTLDCIFSRRAAAEWEGEGSDPCTGAGPSPDDVFLASGISGGSLGLVSWDASREVDLGAGWVDERLGEDFVSPTVAWGLLVEVPRTFLHFEAADRAEVLEESWEASWDHPDENPMERGFLAGQQGAAGSGPILLLNGSSVFEGCALNVSILDIGSTVDEGRNEKVHAECLAPGRYREHALPPDAKESVGEPPGPLPATIDLVDYLLCDDGDPDFHDVRRSSAALLSARFPYVSSAGRLRACDDETSVKFVLDGGIVDSSGAEAAVGVYLEIEPLVERHNARSRQTCIVPYFVQIDNNYDAGAGPQRKVQPPNQILAPLRALKETTGLSSRGARARALAARLFTRPFVTSRAGDAVTDPRYVRIFPRRHPGVEAPLGWLLSEQSKRDLRHQLYDLNADTIRTVKRWITHPQRCASRGT